MNGLHYISKKIKKRIQVSVKRIFANSISPKSLEEKIDKQPIHGKNKSANYHYQLQSSGDKDDLIAPTGSTETGVDSRKPSSSYAINVHEYKRAEQTSKQGYISNQLICPNNRHQNLKSDEPCVCINIEQLERHKTQPLVNEWHKFKSEPTPLDQLTLKKPPTCIQGGQGVVFLVWDEKNRRHFALKMKLRENKGNSSWSIEQRETNILKQISHNFIVNLYHVHETTTSLFMTMEFLDGGCLWSHIAKKGTLPEAYSVYYAACVLEALRYLHTLGIVYRDLKAENIVLDGHGRPKLIDFGMAKQLTKSLDKGGRGESADDWIEKYPATQYYYAAYLAPEIYTRPCSANANIDSWGIGYFVSEILLGYGVFVTMPWEDCDDDERNMKGMSKSGDKRSSGNASGSNVYKSRKSSSNDKWSTLCSKLEQESHPDYCSGGGPISTVCRDLLCRTLVREPILRMNIDEIARHPFFWSIPSWSVLPYVKPPDLTLFRQRSRSSRNIKAVPDNNNPTTNINGHKNHTTPPPPAAQASSQNSQFGFYWTSTLHNPNNTEMTPPYTPSLLAINNRHSNTNYDMTTYLQVPQTSFTSNNNFSTFHFSYHDVPSPTDTPINPKAPSIKSPASYVDKNYYYREYYLKNGNNHLFNIQNNNERKMSALDTISNLKPNWKF